MKRYLFSALFVVAGVVLLIVPHNLTIRGANANFGWLVLGIGVVSLLLDFIKGRRKEAAPPSKPPEPFDPAQGKPPPPTSPPAPPAGPNP
jgi:hypothetical protein